MSLRVWNTSSFSSSEKTPRRLTQGPRLVETVTSGDVVTIWSASAVSVRAISARILPKPSWVEALPLTSGIGNVPTGTCGAL